MLSFDTNILVYAADRQAGNHHAAAVKLIAAAASCPAVLNDQSLIEFIHVATRKQKQTVADAARLARAWLLNFDLITAPATIVEDTVSLMTSYPLSTWDAHMLAICAAHGCNILLSEDMTDGAVYGGVHVLNPFNPANAQTIGTLLIP
jgi:predicted nucleic acid-binding protein